MNTNEIPQEPIRWKYDELAQILHFLNNNFDMWYNSNYNFCVKAKEATGVIWDAESIYNKIHSLFKIMDEYLNTGIKSTACTIIWENNEIYDLVKQIYFKTKKRLKEEDPEIAGGRKSNGHIETILNADQVMIEARIDRPCSIEAIINLCDEKIQKVNNSAVKSIEVVEAKYKEQIHHISQLRSELVKKINETNKMFEEFKKL